MGLGAVLSGRKCAPLIATGLLAARWARHPKRPWPRRRVEQRLAVTYQTVSSGQRFAGVTTMPTPGAATK